MSLLYRRRRAQDFGLRFPGGGAFHARMPCGFAGKGLPVIRNQPRLRAFFSSSSSESLCNSLQLPCLEEEVPPHAACFNQQRACGCCCKRDALLRLFALVSRRVSFKDHWRSSFGRHHPAQTRPGLLGADKPPCCAASTHLDAVSQLKRTKSGKPNTGWRLALSQATVAAS